MLKAEQAGVESESLVGPVRMLREVRLIAGVAEDWMAGFGKVNANLIAATRFEPDLAERRAVEMGDDAKVRDSELPDRFVVSRKSREVLIRRQQALERTLPLLHPAGDDRDILPLGLARREL